MKKSLIREDNWMRRVGLAVLFGMLIMGLAACGSGLFDMSMEPPMDEPPPPPSVKEPQAAEVMEYNSGLMYYRGKGVKQSYTEAAKWFRLSAQKGYAQALYSLGHMYSRGNGVPQSLVQAFKHFSLAAEQGYAPAQFAVGYMYAKGQSVEKDKLLAHMWLNLAAASGVEDAVSLRDQIAKLMTEEELTKAQQMAVEWKPSPPIGLPADG